MIEGTPLSQLAQQLIAERQKQRDFVADTRRLTPHPVGAGVSIELQHADGTTAVAPTRPRGPLKSGQPWPLENRPEVGGHLKIGHG